MVALLDCILWTREFCESPFNFYDTWIFSNRMVTNKIPMLENYLEWIWGPSIDHNSSFVALGNVQSCGGSFPLSVVYMHMENRILMGVFNHLSYCLGTGVQDKQHHVLCLQCLQMKPEGVQVNRTPSGQVTFFMQKERNVWIQKTGKRDGRFPKVPQYIFHK